MKRMMVWVFGGLAMLSASFAFANATATSVTGTVRAQMGVAEMRTLRTGDTVRSGDTVITGPGSSAVLRFEDGQIAALGANSRLVVQAFDYNATTKSGNIVLNLLAGGMRAVTGLIGRSSPSSVKYRAGNYTIGIRGTDVNIAFDGGNALVTVLDGVITFTYGTQTITVPAGEGVNARTDGSFQQGAINEIVRQLQQTPAGQQLLNSIQGLSSLSLAVSNAAAGTSGTVTVPGGQDGTPTFSSGSTPSTSGPSGSAGGGGRPSRR